MGGGGGSTTVGYKYNLGMHMVCCMGPVDLVTAIKVDNKIAWSGSVSSGPITISQPNLFGGDSSEGGVSGTVDFLSGSPTQGVNSYLSSKLGDLVPNFRGVSSFVLRQCYLGNNPYLKPWSFRMQRVFIRQDGIAQWYPEKAGIRVSSSIPLATHIVNFDDANLFYPPTGNNLGAYFDFTTGSSDFVVITKPRAGVGSGLHWDAWSAFLVDAGFGDGKAWLNAFHVRHDATDTFYQCSPNLLYPSADAAYVAAAPAFPITITGYTNYRIYAADDAPGNRAGLSLLVTVTHGGFDMNPAHILRECLTDPDWGMGYNESDIDDTSFTAAADKLFSENMGMSLLWDSQTEIQEFITTVLRHIDAAIYVDRKTGLFVLKLIRDDYLIADLLELTENDIDRVEGFKRPQFGELTTSVTVKYWESSTNTDASKLIQDIALEAMQQASINTTLQYPGFTNGEIASRVAQRDLRALSAQIATCTVYTDRTAKDLQVGDVFLMTWPDYELNRVPMRVTGVAYGDGKSNRIRLTCSEDVFSLDVVAFLPSTPPVWIDPNAPPTPAIDHIAFELPYLELVQQQTQLTVDNNLTADPLMGIVAVAAGRPGTAINAPLWTDSGSGYTQVATADFCPTAKLTVGINKTLATFAITNSKELDLVTLGSWCQVGAEIMSVTALSDTSITVKRGCLDTLPSLHLTDDVLYFWDSFPNVDSTQYNNAESINVKLTPKSGSGIVALADAPVDVVVLAHRAIRPYPPANIKINGAYFPVTVDGDLVITWDHRDRTQQTGGALLGFTDGSVGPETGTTYTFKVYNDSNTLVRTVSGISGATTTYTEAQEITDGGPFITFRITLAAERAGYESWQIFDVTLVRSSSASKNILIDETAEPRVTEDNEVRITE